MSAVAQYRSKINTNQMEPSDWVSFIEETPRGAILTREDYDGVGIYYTCVNGVYYFTRTGAGTRSTEAIEYPRIEIIETVRRADEVEPLRISEAPFGDLLNRRP